MATCAGPYTRGVLYLKFLGCRDRPCPNESTPVRVVEERGQQYITVNLVTGRPRAK